MLKLIAIAREVVDLWVKEQDARNNTHEAKENLVATIKRENVDVVEAE